MSINVNNVNYDFVKDRINALKEFYPKLRSMSDEHIFTVLCVKSNFYKNPSLTFTDSEVDALLVDSIRDGGVDALLADPNSEACNMIICQSKFYKTIKFDDVRAAVEKMILFYRAMLRGEYETVNEKVQRTFITLNAEIGEESKVCFVFYTSAPKNGIREDRIQKLLHEHNLDSSRYEIHLYFLDDVVDEIKESESRRPTVESGKIKIDKARNCLEYGDDAAIVNVSAFSIKELYALHNTNLLSRNIRYFVPKGDIDKAINDTIVNYPETFWFKNNGLTIICDDFEVSGKEVKLSNFSIINGGQTTILIHKSKNISKENDFFLPCKIIRTMGENEDQKNAFSLEISKATNSQKAIKQIDLKANAPEQVTFAREMRNVGIFYQTKRGEKIPRDYQEAYKKTDLVEVGKLCLAGIFQLPGKSRSQPSLLYNEKYYNLIFNNNQSKICNLVKELLYIDNYYRKSFIQKFDKEIEEHSPIASELIPFAHNARTICISFIVLSSHYYNKNIQNKELKIIFDNINKEKAYDDYYYDIFKKIEIHTPLFPKNLFDNKDKYDLILYQLFNVIILSGRQYYSSKKENDNTLNESNFLKSDRNYFAILKFDWDNIATKIMDIYNSI